MNSPLFESVKDLVKLLPEHPGVYQYYNKEGRIIYVGKAKICESVFHHISAKNILIEKQKY